jgi:hypothetical protein
VRVFYELADDVVTSVTSPQPLAEMTYKRVAQAVLEVQFRQNGQVIELPNDAVGPFGVKPTGQYDQATLTTGALTWVKTGSGTDTVYSFIFSLINTELDALLKVDANVADDVPSVTLMAEIVTTYSGSTRKSQTFQFTVQNDVLRGDETVASLVPSIYGIYLVGITALTGGTIGEFPITHLNAIPTVGLLPGMVIQVLIDDGFGNLQWEPQILRAAIAAGTGITTPLDFNAGTNNKRWQTAKGIPGAVGATGPAGGTFAGVDAETLARLNLAVLN